MKLPFVNRKNELRELDALLKHRGLIVIFGRRRVGKTRLLVHWLSGKEGLYSQAIEGARQLQLGQVYGDIKAKLSTTVEPKSWQELHQLIDLEKRPIILCIDEFPYLVATDPTLPSLFQRWLDHSPKKDLSVILAGSSNRMMHDIFLNSTAPLYGRANKILQVKQMTYRDFCGALKMEPAAHESFLKYSFVGGVPKYWEFIDKGKSPLDIANELFFDFAPYMQMEPRRVLKDEGLEDLNPLSILEVIGRGAERPSEIAGRIGTKQTNLSRVIRQLLDAEVITRQIPFGESEKVSKNTIYTITDAALRFWYKVYSPHQSLWHTYPKAKQLLHLNEHASTVFEDYCRSLYPGAKRYWEKDIEIDLVRFEETARPKKERPVVVAEVKWKTLPQRERQDILRTLEQKWHRTKLSQTYHHVRFEVIDNTILTNEGTQ